MKAATETHADVGDKANDAIRVNGARAALPAASARAATSASPSGAGSSTPAAGGRINTDFIDNSAGVDTSDHEVNIKILLDRVVADGDLTEKQRNDLLASMTDEVGDLVLDDNYEQNIALANAEAQRRRCCTSTRTGCAGSSGRACSTGSSSPCRRRKEVAERLDRGEGLTTPELSVLLAYTKIVLADELIGPTCPTTRSCAPTCSATSRRRCGRPTASRWRATRCAARSS